MFIWALVPVARRADRKIMIEYEKSIIDNLPDLVLVAGDVNSTRRAR
jgi:UDP-N-acetylglucosamine 2-epimerase